MKKILDLIYPPICPICKKVLPYDKHMICDSCMEKLKIITSPKCLKCGKAIDDETQEYCYDCNHIPKSFGMGYPVYHYEEPLKKALLDFKYQNKREYADFFANSLLLAYKTDFQRFAPDGIVPVPIHKKKKNSRGYNQTELLAEKIGKTLNIPVFKYYLKRIIATAPQKELSAKERILNLKNAFKIGENNVQLKKVLLIDDIYTSGATIEACTQILMSNGTECVHFACIAIGSDR